MYILDLKSERFLETDRKIEMAKSADAKGSYVSLEMRENQAGETQEKDNLEDFDAVFWTKVRMMAAVGVNYLPCHFQPLLWPGRAQ